MLFCGLLLTPFVICSFKHCSYLSKQIPQNGVSVVDDVNLLVKKRNAKNRGGTRRGQPENVSISGDHRDTTKASRESSGCKSSFLRSRWRDFLTPSEVILSILAISLDVRFILRRAIKRSSPGVTFG